MEVYTNQVYTNPLKMNPSYKIDEYLVKSSVADLSKMTFPTHKKALRAREKVITKFLDHYRDNKGYRKRIGYTDKPYTEYLAYVTEIAQRHFQVKEVIVSYEIIHENRDS